MDIVLNLRGMPENGRASLWVGRTTDFQKWAAMPMKGEPVQGAKVSFSRPVHLAFRRLGQGYMLRHTDDCFVLTIEAGGQRRYLIYDLREDIQLKFLRVGKKLTLTFDMGWHSLWREVKFPEPSERIYLGW